MRGNTTGRDIARTAHTAGRVLDRAANRQHAMITARRCRTPVARHSRSLQHARKRAASRRSGTRARPAHKRAIAGRRRVARTRSSVHSVQHAERPTPARAMSARRWTGVPARAVHEGSAFTRDTAESSNEEVLAQKDRPPLPCRRGASCTCADATEDGEARALLGRSQLNAKAARCTGPPPASKSAIASTTTRHVRGGTRARRGAASRTTR